MIHKTAIIDKTAVIEDNVSIGAYSVIGEGVIIKSGTAVGSNVYIEYAEIGKNCKIFHSASIGTAPQDLSYKDEPSKAYIGEGTTLREFVTVNRGTAKTGKTVVGKNCFFMVSTHVGHDCKVGDNVILTNSSSLGGHVEVGDNAFISGMCGVHQFTRVGRDTMTAGTTIITMDTLPFTLCYGGSVGNRAVINGLNLVGMKRRGMMPEDIEAIKNAYRILFMSKLLLKDSLCELEKSASPYVKEMVDFIKTSKRGIARPGN
ncbi:MAG: acyl-ACP--UDP-N-acetylglucosamine O-acyltransferase [Endomicrobia bacterium]|nr:acyl-ACP--UDP-N-acetylglucosamine O-acyltransferase [Endomicrobiia bacterium]